MIPIEQLQTELVYNPETGNLLRRKTMQPVYLERCGIDLTSLRIEVAGKRVSAQKAVLALWLGRYPEKHEYRRATNDIYDLRIDAFRRRRGDGRKDCALCGANVPLDSYHRDRQSKDNRATYCVDCARQKSQQYNRTATVTKYGMTEQDFEDMSAAQGYKCRLCARPASEERYGKLSVDHCHHTGVVRGLLCMRCNTALGKFADDPLALLNAAKYLLGKL